MLNKRPNISLPKITEEEFQEILDRTKIKTKHLELARKILVGGEKASAVAKDAGLSRSQIYAVLNKFTRPKEKFDQKGKVKKQIVDSHGCVTCVTCGESLPLEAFTPDKRRPNGVSSNCRDCLAIKKTRQRAEELYDQIGPDLFGQEVEKIRKTLQVWEDVLQKRME